EHLSCRAAREARAGVAFYRELLEAELCALTPEVQQNEERVTLQTEKKVALVVWEGPQGRYTPLFSSRARVDQIARYQGKAMGLMAMKGEQLFALLAQMKTPACLNPGFSFGKEFVPEEIAALADGSIFGGEQRVIRRDRAGLPPDPCYIDPVLKICPLCRRTWSGGRDCPHCGEGHALIDIAEPQGRKTFLRDRELAAAIRGYYGARTGMLIAFWGILVGLVLALFLWRKAMLAPAGHQVALIAAAGVCAVVPIVLAVVHSTRGV